MKSIRKVTHGAERNSHPPWAHGASAEAMRTLSDDTFRRIVETAIEGIWLIDSEWAIAYVNPRMADMLGYEPWQMVGRSALEFFRPDDIEQVQAGLARVQEDGFTGTFEACLRCRDGSDRWTAIRFAPLSDAAGQSVGTVWMFTDIGDRKQAEEDLRKSQFLLNTIVEGTSDAVYVKDREGRYLFFNPAAEATVGKKFAEVVGRDDTAIFPPEQARVIMESDQSIIESGQRRTFEETITMASGQRITYYSTKGPLFDDQQRVIGVFGIARDITERKQAQEVLQKSNQGLQLLAEIANRLLTEENPRAAVESLCHRVLPVLGCDLFLNYLKIEDRNALKLNAYGGISQDVAKAIDILEYGTGVCGWAARDACRTIAEHIQERADPRADLLRPLGIRAYASHPLFSREGRIIGTLSFGSRTRDEFSEEDLSLMKAVTDQVAIALERMWTQEALRKSEERFRRLAETSTFGLAIIDLQGGISYANPILLKLFGYSRQDVEAGLVRWDALTPSQFFPRIERAIREVLTKGTCAPFEMALIDRGGRQVPVLVGASLLERRTNGKTTAAAFVTDLSSVKETERELQKAKELLEERVRERTGELQRTVEELVRSNADLERFAYVSSHDLQEPLRMVASYVGLLAHKYQDKLDDEANEFIGYAIEGAQRMSGLIKDLLEYSRINSCAQPIRPTNMQAVLDRALANLKLQIVEADAEITHDPLPVVPADETQLVQVFQNLLGNALKFRKDNEPPRIHIGCRNQDGRWVFDIQDNGIGIDPAYLGKIFVVFQRLHARRDKYPGTGIGLAIVKRIIERHGGEVWVESEPGRGSTFYFTLPNAGNDISRS